LITDIDSVVMAFAAITMTGIDRTSAPPARSHHAPQPGSTHLLAGVAHVY
jgi:hypothetical protein